MIRQRRQRRDGMTGERKDRRTEGPMDRRTEGPKDQRTKGPKDQRTEGPKDQRTKGPKDQRTKGPKDQRTKGPKDQRTEGPKDQRTEGPKDQRTKGQKDRRTEGPKNRRTRRPLCNRDEAAPMDPSLLANFPPTLRSSEIQIATSSLVGVKPRRLDLWQEQQLAVKMRGDDNNEMGITCRPVHMINNHRSCSNSCPPPPPPFKPPNLPTLPFTHLSRLLHRSRLILLSYQRPAPARKVPRERKRPLQWTVPKSARRYDCSLRCFPIFSTSGSMSSC
jgi:hypothetical protein